MMKIYSYLKRGVCAICLLYALIIGCCADHYALVRVSVRDVGSGELFTSDTCSVGYSFPCYNFLNRFGPMGQRCIREEKILRPEDGGIKWFWIHGNTDKARFWLGKAPMGYYRTHSNSVDSVVQFSSLMTYLPIPIHFPPFRTATVYMRRQMDPIDVEIHTMNEHPGPKFNGVDLVSYRPGSRKVPVLTTDYEFTASYDCLKGDYCSPLGHGEVGDILFDYSYRYMGTMTNSWGETVHKYVKSRKMSFPGKGNGFVFRELPSMKNGHEFDKADFTAPDGGYVKEDESSYGSNIPYDGRYNVCFDFRVRCQFGENGELKSCYYGRWHGRYSFEDRLCGQFYVNPKPLDRNLELLYGKRKWVGNM